MVGAFVEYAAVAAVAGVAAVTITLVIHIAKYGEEKGAMRERIKRLEQEMIEQKEIKDTVIELKGSVNALNNTITDFKDMMMRVLQMSGK